ncbi:MAG TPA: phenylacetate--CoA ligase [Methanoculleus sp.]|jgi:phenylacetate-CoA ligase|uniref:phenylacetate--CoA ligase family protein n=1 Tax=Methanoculleus sp. TaxID=90427 RepID=UPI001B4CB409|nr:AMP-binding protein [Methanoculleus sp.]MBP7144381.1 phenylacetate--CoA ligase [Methanoculleus sp.]HOC84003.1 phenylacetate--CoA ligase [Methanoculleus sp.]HOF96156.1 phenylacetate--CoA ligase [Methanoculleus sp.]HOI61718.1 phenylacetate--CoA ligase [Methanoculleus sp.]HOZ42485.1 phenylacetate--CoA ligase [Methanoculleus sp.]
MFWNRAIETIRPEELADLQLKRLKWALRQAQEVGLYQRKFREAGISPDDIRTLDDVEKLPFTYKKELQAGYPFGLFAVPMREIVRIHTTSGTTGKPTVVGYTRQDLDNWADLIARNMTMIGLGVDDVFQNAVNYGLFTGGLGFHYGAEKIGMTVIPSATGNTRRQIEMIEDFGVTAIHCTPSYALHLAEVAESMGKTLDTLKTGIFGAEPWSENTRVELERRLGVKAYDSYGLSEMYGPGVAFECPEHNGLHIWHDCYLTEVIDPVTGERLAPGERGEMVITPLVKEALPLVRYRTGDITRLLEGECACGRGQKIERITGRSDDMLVIRGINIFPSQIEHVLRSLPEVGDQFMVYVDRVRHLDEMTIEVEMTRAGFSGELQDLARVQKKIVGELHSTLGLRTAVKLVEPGSLPRFEGKAKRVIDRRGAV